MAAICSRIVWPVNRRQFWQHLADDEAVADDGGQPRARGLRHEEAQAVGGGDLGRVQGYSSNAQLEDTAVTA